MIAYPRKMLFMTSLTENGTPILVDVLGENKRIEGGLYIRYPTGGTDTTRPNFLFEIPAELTEENERLQARVAELVAVAVSVRDDLLLRSEIDSDGTRCVNLSASKWNLFCDVIDDNNSGALILRKQAEALDKYSNDLDRWVDERPEEVRDDGFCKGVRRSAISASNIAKRLRNDAGNAEGADNAK